MLKKLYYNLVTLSIVVLITYVFFYGLHKMTGPLNLLDQNIKLDASYLPEYLLRTAMRFLIAIISSVLIAIIYAIVMVKNKRIRRLLLPLLDIFQSIPVLGYLSFTVTFFVALAPHNIWGIEMAVIFAIFTAQIWNIIFSLYQSFMTLPSDLDEVSRMCKLNKWQIFWKIEMPFAIPGLVTNIILSMNCSWYFVIAQEVISVGNHSYAMPGMGAYIAAALQKMDHQAMLLSLVAILCLILIYSEVIFRPLTAWSYKFRYEFNVGENGAQSSWFLSYLQKSYWTQPIVRLLKNFCKRIVDVNIPSSVSNYAKSIAVFFEIIWWLLVAWSLCEISCILYGFCNNHLGIADLISTLKLGLYTAIRVLALILLSSLVWIPIGTYIGLRPKLVKAVQPITQLLTAIPANFYYPLFVGLIISYNLNPNIWLSGMIVVGSQWFILYNVIGGAQTIPTELLEASAIFKLNYLNKITKIILPSIAPFYITGVVTASGASWNASIIAEIITWGTNTLTADGLGAYIATNTNLGNYAHISLGVITMSIFVITINYFIWKPLQNYISNKYRLL